MDYERTHELGRRFAEALHAVDARADGAIDQIVGCFSPTARLLNASLKQAGDERTGHEAIRAFWEAYQGTFQEAATEFFAETAGEKSAGLFWTTTGRDATGAEVNYDGATLLVFDDQGQVELFRGYYDTRELTRTVAT